MAVLNEYYNYGPNYAMLIMGVIGMLASMGLYLWASIRCIYADNWDARFRNIIVGLLAIVCASIWAFMAANYSNPEYRVPKGKKQIEATFALGHPSAYILKSYDVVGMKGDNVYILEEK